MSEVVKDIAWLNSKWWYRLLKVAFVLFFSLVTIGICVAAWDQRPKQSLFLNQERSVLVCNSGQRYAVNGLGVVDTINMDYEINTANYVCKTGEIPNLIPNVRSPAREFYVEEAYDIVGGWSDVLEVWFGGGVLMLLLALFIRGLFCYIVCGTWLPGSSTESKAVALDANN